MLDQPSIAAACLAPARSPRSARPSPRAAARPAPPPPSASRSQRTPADWQRRLGPDRYRILREAGTEAPFTSPLDKEKRRGIFACAGCGLPLFCSATKYDSGTGWPSFYAALPNAIRTKRRRRLRHDPHRGTLPPLRRASRPYLRRRPAADRQAPLHQRPLADLQAGLGAPRSRQPHRVVGRQIIALGGAAAAFGGLALELEKGLRRIGREHFRQPLRARAAAVRSAPARAGRRAHRRSAGCAAPRSRPFSARLLQRPVERRDRFLEPRRRTAPRPSAGAPRTTRGARRHRPARAPTARRARPRTGRARAACAASALEARRRDQPIGHQQPRAALGVELAQRRAERRDPLPQRGAFVALQAPDRPPRLCSSRPTASSIASAPCAASKA